ncbi:TRAP transporter large permease [Succinatimonas hippei]|uniref:TRAP transporter large permease n=1 Tax=Succinatimonas hippei TaxID=626938 RepID=UPI002011CE07|nr:TRAP transporter large permease [Succinatimonas hippei]MCL1603709.1 TRAP transporter large permease [Succinatimonas hippei]MDM8119922.1 TRAP transporter large permease [Succinatimonas hippei]
MTITVALIMAITMIVLLILGVPICIAIAISSILAGANALDFNMMLQTGAQRTFTGISVFTLIAIPFFILAGNIMNQGGIAIRLMNFARLLVGKIPGSYAHTNSMANMMFGAISGSGVAAASAMGTIIGPIAVKEGYSRNYMATVNIATAPTGLLIPPSNVLITYSLVSGGTSVAALFLAGYIPGILWGLSCMIVAYFWAKKIGYKGDSQKITAALALKVTLEAVPSLLLILIVIGGIVAGAFTATEGAIVAVVYSLILSICYRSITWKALVKIYADSAKMTGIIVLLIGVSSIMSWVISFVNIPSLVGEMLNGVSSNPIIILLIINIILLIVGTFLDTTPAILIFTPIFLPIAIQCGLSPVEFGIVITFNLCIGTITPPVGNILFVGVKVAQTTIERVIKPLIPFYIVIIAVLMLCTYVPQISSFIPELCGYEATLPK